MFEKNISSTKKEINIRRKINLIFYEFVINVFDYD